MALLHVEEVEADPALGDLALAPVEGKLLDEFFPWETLPPSRGARSGGVKDGQLDGVIHSCLLVEPARVRGRARQEF